MTTELFDDFNSVAPILAFCHLHYGADPVRELLAKLRLDREYLEHEARELEAIGLPDVAALVWEAATLAGSEIEHCPYAPEDHRNYQAWMNRRQRLAESPLSERTANKPKWAK